MHNIKKYRYLIIITLIIIFLFIILIIKVRLVNNKYTSIEPEIIPNDEYIIKEKEPVIDSCTVDIKGAVARPGTYTTTCDKKVVDIIELAGGLTAEANTDITNLAKTICDEMVIVIYTQKEVIDTTEKETNIIEEEIISGSDIGNNENTPKLLNINTASLNELISLPGIGNAKASAIISYREANGPFKSTADIQNVKGIGPSLYEKIKAYITT